MGLLIKDLDEWNPPVEVQGRVTIRLVTSPLPGDFLEVLHTDRGVTEMILTVPSGVSIEAVP